MGCQYHSITIIYSNIYASPIPNRKEGGGYGKERGETGKERWGTKGQRGGKIWRAMWKGRTVEGEDCGRGGVWRQMGVEGEECGGGWVWKGRSVEGEGMEKREEVIPFTDEVRKRSTTAPPAGV